jgi:POT family proton-dependent oligopeptide transporter
VESSAAQRLERHPSGLFYIAIITGFFNYSLGGINSLMVLYLTHQFHMADSSAYAIFAAFNALIFTLPILGGYLASRFGYRYAVSVGAAFCLVAAVILSFPRMDAFYVGMGLYASGYGLALPALFSIPSMLYDRQDGRRASGMTLFYIIMNVGFLLAGVFSGYLSQGVSYQAAYLLVALSLLVALILMCVVSKRIKPFRPNAFKPLVAYTGSQICVVLSVFVLIGLPVAYFFILDNSYSNLIMWVAAVLSVLTVLNLARLQEDPLAKRRLYAFVVLECVGLFFWVIYMLEPSLLTIFIANNVDRHLFGHLIPAASYYSLDSILVIALGFFLSYIWRSMSRHGVLPSIPAKFSTAIVLMGLGSLALTMGIHMSGQLHLTHSGWIVLAYVFFALAELFIAPIAIAMIGRLAPNNHVGTLMGIFNLFVGFSAILSGYIGRWTTIPKHDSLFVSNGIYAHSFLLLGLSAVVIGALSMFLIPSVKRLIGS